jgi:hypothetical protein
VELPSNIILATLKPTANRPIQRSIVRVAQAAVPSNEKIAMFQLRRRPRCSALGPNITAAEAMERYNTNTLVEKLTPISGLGPLQDETTAQYTAAMMWLAGSDPAILDLAAVEFDHLVQRYLMVLLYYIRPTRVTKWTNKRGFPTADTVWDCMIDRAWNATTSV